MLAVFAALALYTFGKAVYDIGRNDGRRMDIDLSLIHISADHPIIQTETKGRNDMRNTSKMTTLENKFPLLSVEHGCIISKDADITVAFEVELPELYTVTGAEYEAIHGCWCKAIKVLPDFCVCLLYTSRCV